MSREVREGRSIQFKLIALSMGITFFLGVGSLGVLQYVASVLKNSQDHGVGAIDHAKNIFYGIFGVMMTISAIASYYFSVNLSRKLSDLAARLSDGVGHVTHAAEILSKSGDNLSAAVTDQAAAIQETAAAVDEVSSMISRSAENAAQSQKSSENSRKSSEKGQAAVQEMIQSITDISNSNQLIVSQVEESNRKIGEIVQVISEIGNKTKVINDIVFQTKLLSFNASVEAARAGEYGKGFAVVAEEVGNLAQMSGNAAKEISSMLDGGIQKVQKIVTETQSQIETLINENRTKIEAGTQVAGRCGTALTEIMSTVHEVDSMVSEIATASKEQSQGVTQINKAINQLDQVTQKNSEVAKSTAGSSVELIQDAKNLKQVALELFFLISGKMKEQSIAKKSPSEPVITVRSAAVTPVPAPVSAEKKPVQPTAPAAKPAPIAAKTEATPVKPQAAVSASKLASRESAPKETKKVGGSDQIAVPSFDDPRFEDV